MDWTGFVILKSRVTSHFIMIKIVNLSFFSAVWMNRHVRRLHIAITTNKGEARNFIILLHDHPNRIAGYILFSPVGETQGTSEIRPKYWAYAAPMQDANASAFVACAGRIIGFRVVKSMPSVRIFSGICNYTGELKGIKADLGCIAEDWKDGLQH